MPVPAEHQAVVCAVLVGVNDASPTDFFTARDIRVIEVTFGTIWMNARPFLSRIPNTGNYAGNSPPALAFASSTEGRLFHLNFPIKKNFTIFRLVHNGQAEDGNSKMELKRRLF